jgi:hypothetical protein
MLKAPRPILNVLLGRTQQLEKDKHPVAHESFLRNEEEVRSSDRSFGWVFAVVFAIIALLPLLGALPPLWWAAAVSAVFAGFAVVAPQRLAPLNRLWMRFGALLHRIVTPVVLGFMFFFVITPIGLLMRATGKDPLRLKLDRNARTYWIERVPPGPAPHSLERQF